MKSGWGKMGFAAWLGAGKVVRANFRGVDAGPLNEGKVLNFGSLG